MDKMKRSVLLILMLGLFLVASSLVSAVCCEKAKSGDWCQDVSSSDSCVLTGDLRWNSASCDRTTYCSLGTCVNVNTGTCSPNTEMTVCEKEGGQWDQRDINEIEMCKNGCCVLGEQVAFVTKTECSRLSTKYAVDSIFKSDVTTESSCYDLSQPAEVGACVFDEDYTKNCKMISKESCLAQDGQFNRGLLCTAPGLSDCAKTGKTTCKNEKVYFLDSCGNLANVYDSRMFSSSNNGWTQEMNDYWTKIQDAKCSIKTNGADSCGNCDYLGGTTCSSYKTGMIKPDYGNNVCKSLSCEYKGETYEHGESWCATGSGLNPGINVNPKTGYITGSERTKLVNNYDKLNLPGTEYMKLQCWDGEVIKYPCDPFRTEVCKEASIGEFDNFSIAQCMVNNWKSCVTITNKESCEDVTIDCKWLPGERFDGKITSEERRDNEQGSCVPLIAPGFRFWDLESDETGSEICAMGLSTMNVLYETSWTWRRDNFEKLDLDASDGTSVQQQCLENCYAIPKYADDLGVTDAKALWNGEDIPTLQTEEVSLRKGYYCAKETDPTKERLGTVRGTNVKCIERAEDQESWLDDLFTNIQRRPLPIFYTNSEWLAFLTERTRSLGDCGYKLGVSGDYSSTQSELMTASFQKLTQQMGVKEEVAETSIIYEADNSDVGLRLLEENYYRSTGETGTSIIYVPKNTSA